MLELNAGIVQGNVYLAVAYGGAFPDELYITPAAPWLPSGRIFERNTIRPGSVSGPRIKTA